VFAQFEFKRVAFPLEARDTTLLCNRGSACDNLGHHFHYFFFVALTTVIMQPKQQAKKETCKPCGTTQGDKAKASTAKPDAKVDPK
jgi:hypothetical protein